MYVFPCEVTNVELDATVFMNKSAVVNFPGGGKTTTVCKVRKWFDLSVSAVSTDVVPSAIGGWLLTTACALHMKVGRASSFIQ